MTENDPIIMYLVVRKSLNMSIGKTAAQCSHAVGLLFESYIKLQEKVSAFEQLMIQQSVADIREHQKLADRVGMWKAWLNTAYTKIVLGSNEIDWDKIKKELSTNDMIIVEDLGRTELTPNTQTVIGLFPAPKSQVPKCIKKLQLLK